MTHFFNNIQLFCVCILLGEHKQNMDLYAHVVAPTIDHEADLSDDTGIPVSWYDCSGLYKFLRQTWHLLRSNLIFI